MTFLLKIGMPIHLVKVGHNGTNEHNNMTACGILAAKESVAHDGRDVNCLRCRKTKQWRTYMRRK